MRIGVFHMLRGRIARAVAAVVFLSVVAAAGTLEVTWAHKVARAVTVTTH